MIKLLNWIAGLQPTSNKRVPREEDPPGLVQSEVRGYLIPRAVVVHPNKVEMAALEHLKVEPVVYQNLQLGEVFTPPPTPVSKRPWALEGWRNANGECWWSPRKGPAYWRMVDPTLVQAGWLLPHYAIPVIPGIEGGQV